MKLEFSEIMLSRIGVPSSSGDAMGGKLELRFRDIETGRYSAVELSLFLPRRPDVTFAELQTASRDQAKTILREALSCLEAHSVDELERQAADTAKKRP